MSIGRAGTALARKTGAWEVIEKQPTAWTKSVGTFAPSGTTLRAEWQKIALLRCAYRDDAKIMVLDEPTAALDPLPAELYRSFAIITGSRTTILIFTQAWHYAARPIVFSCFRCGRIVETEHIRSCWARRLSAKMYRSQAHWYE